MTKTSILIYYVVYSSHWPSVVCSFLIDIACYNFHKIGLSVNFPEDWRFAYWRNFETVVLKIWRQHNFCFLFQIFDALKSGSPKSENSKYAFMCREPQNDNFIHKFYLWFTIQVYVMLSLVPEYLKQVLLMFTHTCR